MYVTSKKESGRKRYCLKRTPISAFILELLSKTVGLAVKIRTQKIAVGMSARLRAGRFGDRIPVGKRCFLPVQNGPVEYPASCIMSTGSFQ